MHGSETIHTEELETIKQKMFGKYGNMYFDISGLNLLLAPKSYKRKRSFNETVTSITSNISHVSSIKTTGTRILTLKKSVPWNRSDECT